MSLARTEHSVKQFWRNWNLKGKQRLPIVAILKLIESIFAYKTNRILCWLKQMQFMRSFPRLKKKTTKYMVSWASQSANTSWVTLSEFRNAIFDGGATNACLAKISKPFHNINGSQGLFIWLFFYSNLVMRTVSF